MLVDNYYLKKKYKIQMNKNYIKQYKSNYKRLLINNK